MAIRQPMGSLEAEVLRCLSDHAGGLTPAEVQAMLDRPLAYTTVATVLVRLSEKGQAQRVVEGRGYRYLSRVTPEEVIAQRMHVALDGAQDHREALVHFVDDLKARDAKALRAILDGSKPPK